jgi:hypothetical protein
MLIIRFIQLHSCATVPETQSLDLVCAFHVGHSHLQYGGSTVGAQDGSNLRASGIFKWRTHLQRPALFQLLHQGRQIPQPRAPFRSFFAIR